MKIKETNGVTLIALAITIIILLILVGVVISTLTGSENNIFKNANMAVEQYRESTREEQEILSILEEKLNEHFGEQNTKNELPRISVKTNAEGQELQKKIIITVVAESTSSKITKIILPDNNEKIIENPDNKITFNYEATENKKFDFIAVDQNQNKSEICSVDIKNVEYTGTIVIKEITNRGRELEGAEYKIATSEENINKGIYVKDEKGADVIMITDKNGMAQYTGLAYGNYGESKEEASKVYYLNRIKAAAGFNKLLTPIQVVVNQNSDNNIIRITNTESSLLPSPNDN